MMKKWLVLLLMAVLLSAFSAAAAQDDTLPTATVTATLLNVRYGPGTTYNVLTKVMKGLSYQILGRNDDSSWWQINLGGAVGWVNARYVSTTHAESVPAVELPACPYTTFLAPHCPDSQVNVDVDMQTFEHGTMLWRSDTKQIYVLFNDGTFLKATDTWAGETLSQETPPAGLQQPQNGFGKVWLANDTVRRGLGWATAGEVAYNTPIESDSGTHPRPSDNFIYLKLAGGQVISLSEYLSRWYSH